MVSTVHNIYKEAYLAKVEGVEVNKYEEKRPEERDEVNKRAIMEIALIDYGTSLQVAMQ